MYLKKYDYKHHPENEILLELARYRGDAIRDISSHSEQILQYFMRVWLYSYRYGIDHWVQELAYKFITKAPIVKPKNKIMDSKDIIKYIELDKLMSDRNLKNTLEKLLRQYKKFDPRPDYEVNFPESFKDYYHQYVKKFVKELRKSTTTGLPITELDIEDILDSLNMNEGIQ